VRQTLTSHAHAPRPSPVPASFGRTCFWRAGPKAAAHLSIIILAVFSLLADIYRGNLNLRRSPLDLPFVLFLLIILLSVGEAALSSSPSAAR